MSVVNDVHWPREEIRSSAAVVRSVLLKAFGSSLLLKFRHITTKRERLLIVRKAYY